MARYNTISTTSSVAGGSTISTPNSGLLTTLTGSGTVTIPNPILYTGQQQSFYNSTGSAITLNTPSGTFLGAATGSTANLSLVAGAIVTIVSDGANYEVLSWPGGSVSITGGSINGATVGAGTASSGAFTTLNASSTTSLSSMSASSAQINGTLGASGSVTFTNGGAVTLGTAASGALQVTGGVGVGGGVYVAGTSSFSGSVGIGTNSPSEILHVSGTGDAVLRLASTATSGKAYNITSGGNGNYSPGVFAIRDVSAATTPFAIYNSNIGIGTTSPLSGVGINLTLSQSLALGVSSSTTGDIISSGGGNSSTYNGIAIVSNSRGLAGVQANTALSSWIVDIGGRGADGTTFNVNTGDTFRIARAAAGGTFYGATEVLRITNTGNVGIGTTSPQAKLHINAGSGAISIQDYKRIVYNLDASILEGNTYQRFSIGINTSNTTYARTSAYVRVTVVPNPDGGIGLVYSSVAEFSIWRIDGNNNANFKIISVDNGTIGIATPVASNNSIIFGFSMPNNGTSTTPTFTIRVEIIAADVNNYVFTPITTATTHTGTSLSGYKVLTPDNTKLVGVGTPTPGALLHVYNTGGSTNSANTALIVGYDSTAATTTGGGTAIELRGTSSGGNITNYQQARIRSVSQPTNNAHGIAFDYKPNAASSFTEALQISPGGYVSIGNVYPTYPLTINGNSGASTGGTSINGSNANYFSGSKGASASTTTINVYVGNYSTGILNFTYAHTNSGDYGAFIQVYLNNSYGTMYTQVIASKLTFSLGTITTSTTYNGASTTGSYNIVLPAGNGSVGNWSCHIQGIGNFYFGSSGG